MAEIPVQLLTQDWLQGIIAETREIEATLSDHWIARAEHMMRKHEESTSQPKHAEGDLVLLAKPFYERGTGAILPQSDGPYFIARMPSPHTAILEDVYSGELYLNGRPVAVNRLIRYAYPVEWATEHETKPDAALPLLQQLQPGDYVAVEPQTQSNKRIYIAQVKQVIKDQSLVEVALYHVPSHARYGPWQRRPWVLWPTPEGQPRIEIIPATEILCQVTLRDSALDAASLTLLAQCGIDVGSMPRRDHNLPASSH